MENEETIDLLAYLSRLKRHLLPAALVALATMLAMGLMAVLGNRATPEAEIEVRSHVLVRPHDINDAAQAEYTAQMLSPTMRTFVALEDAPQFLEAVQQKVGDRFTPEEVRDQTSIYWGGGSNLLAIKATAVTEEDAIALSDAYAEVFVDKADEVLKADEKQIPELVIVEKAAQAAGAKKPVATGMLGTVLHALPQVLIAGLGLGVLTAILLEWRSARRRPETARVHRTTTTR